MQKVKNSFERLRYGYEYAKEYLYVYDLEFDFRVQKLPTLPTNNPLPETRFSSNNLKRGWVETNLKIKTITAGQTKAI